MEFKMCVSFFLAVFFFSNLSVGAPPQEFLGARRFLDTSLNADKNDGMTIFRLPKNIRPKEYELKIVTDVETTFEFIGTVIIKVVVDVPTQYIVLNSKQLQITKMEVKNQRGFNIFANFTLDAPNEQLSIYCPELSVRKEYTVQIDFKTVLSNDMSGYYRSSYTIKDTTKWLSTTQFEPTYARKAFPCFDEPGFKTPYTIQLAIKPGQTALSNMPIESTSNPDPSIGNKVWVKFKKSEPMPTYLVAYSVSSFVVYQKTNERVRVWSREDAIDDCKYIQEKGEALLKAMEQYLKVDYKLPKLDILAVPDFSAGAMENYGLTTYRERFVHNTDLATARNTEFIVSVVAHEFSHQWFGDLVTPYWWDYTWLNEAFATFFEYRATDLVEPTWRMKEVFVVEQVQTAMLADLEDSHPITANVNSPGEINAIFDNIIYNKGGSVLRMLEHFITPEAFQSALSTYLTQCYSEGGVTDPGTFFEAVTDTVNTMTNQDWHDTMNKFKSSWIDQSGFPLVTVKRDYAKQTATVSQQQFLLEGSGTPSDRQWLIPLTYTTSNEKNFALEEAKKKLVLFNPSDKTATLDVKSARWLMVNIQEIGFYRVNYDEDNWKEIISTLHNTPTDIHQLNRAQLIDDSFNLARAGIIPYSTAMSLSKYLAKETDPIPWLAAFPNFRFLLQRYQSKLNDQFKKHISGLLKNIYEALMTKTSKDHTDKTGLITISQWACYVDVESCLNKVKTEMDKFVQNPEYKIEPEIKESVFCTGLRKGGETEWNAVWNYYLKTNVATEKVLVLNMLPCSTYGKALEFLLNELITGKNIRSQDYTYLVRSIASNAHHIHPALKLIREKYPDILAGVIGEKLFKLLVNQIKPAVTTAEQLKEIETLANSDTTAHEHVHMLNHTIDHIKKNFEWQDKYLSTLEKWFEDDNKPQPNPPRPTDNPGPGPGPTNKPSSAVKPYATLVSCTLVFFVLYRRQDSFPL